MDDLESSKYGLASVVASLLQNNYKETGVLLIYDESGTVHPLTYIANDEYLTTKDEDNSNVLTSQSFYYIVDPSTYLKDTIIHSAIEDGELRTYNGSGKAKANIHKAKRPDGFFELLSC